MIAAVRTPTTARIGRETISTHRYMNSLPRPRRPAASVWIIRELQSRRVRRAASIFGDRLRRSNSVNGARCRSRRLFESEPDLENDLVLQLRRLDLPSGLQDLEPADPAQFLRRAGDGAFDRILDALFRRACDFDDSVDVIGHRCPPLCTIGTVTFCTAIPQVNRAIISCGPIPARPRSRDHP